MFERIKAYGLNGRVALQKAETELELMKQINKLAEGNAILPEADEASWTKLGGSAEKELGESDQEILRDQATNAYYRNPHGRNIFRLFEKYVAGHGFGIEPMSSIPPVKEYWKKFWKKNKMDLKKKEIVRRAFRDGEVFIRYFPADNKEDIMKFRFMDPAFVVDPDDKNTEEQNIKYGIKTNPEDIEDVKSYWYNGIEIPAEEVQHIKIMVDSDVLRGRSFVEPILPSLANYQLWQKDRIELNRLRNTMGLLKTVTGNPTQTANIGSGNDTSNKLNADGTPKTRAPKGVSIWTANKGVDYELKSPNLQASDVQKDGEAILLTAAAGSGLPEFMVTSNASNSNYASTVTAEGPAVMEFEDWQDFFAYHFKEMYERVILDGIKTSALPATEIETTEEEDENGKVKEIKETIPLSTECSITFPDLVARDIKDETEALIMQNNQGWVSPQTAQAALDLDTEDEDELMRKWDREHPEDDDDFKKDKEDLEIEKQKKKMEDEE